MPCSPSQGASGFDLNRQQTLRRWHLAETRGFATSGRKQDRDLAVSNHRSAAVRGADVGAKRGLPSAQIKSPMHPASPSLHIDRIRQVPVLRSHGAQRLVTCAGICLMRSY